MACLDVEGRDCLVVGGGAVGLEKTIGFYREHGDHYWS